MIAYETVTSAMRLGAIAEEVAQAEVIALDLETTGLDPRESEIRLCSLNTGKGVYVIDAFQTGTLEPIVRSLADSKGVKVGQNLKFDQKFLVWKHGLELWPLFDTYRASALVYNGKFMGKGAHDLYALYSRELGIGPEAPDLGGSNWSAPILTKEQLDYAAEDVIHLPKLREKLKPKLRDFRLNDIALIEFQAILPEAMMELNGIFFDQTAWLRLATHNKAMADKLRKELVHELPHPKSQIALPGFDPDFNIDSTAQMLKSLQQLGLQTKNPDTGAMRPIHSTNEIVIAGFTKEHPVVGKVLKYREYATAVKSFGADYLRYVSKQTGRIHTSYFPFTGAGRYASSDPNLQQIPRKKEFRACFQAPPGKCIIAADYSQIELRIAAELACDETLMGVYQRGEDAHAQTASLVSNVALKEVTKDQRQMAKAVNFGLIYGMGADKLVLYAQANYNVTMTVGEAKTFRSRYFDAYEGVRRWHGMIFSDENKKRGITRTIAGRLRYLPITSHSEWANTPVQGTGADGLKRALARVYSALKKYGDQAKMVHMVHDEILIEANDDPTLIQEIRHLLEEGMVTAIQPMLKKVPVVAESKYGPNWAEAK
jgi:DNA polymerase-1